MRSDAAKLRSIHGFTKAGIAAGGAHVRAAIQEFGDTQHSCYNEGWARGFEQAMTIAEEFVRETLDGASE